MLINNTTIKRAHWVDEQGGFQVTSQPVVRVERAKRVFYARLNVNRDIRKYINIYNTISKEYI